MAFSLQILKDHIRQRLGASSVVVELSDGDVIDAITSAIAHFDSAFPVVGNNALTVTGTVKRYVISHKNLIDVVELKVIPNTTPLGVPIVPQIYTVGEMLPAEYPVGEMNFLMMRQKDLMRTLSQNIIWESSWEYNPTTHQQEYVIYLDLPELTESTTYKCSYKYASYHTTDDDKEAGLGTIRNPYHQEWIKKYAVAIAKHTLGTIRNKFKGLPSPDGSDMQIDGYDLIVEANTEQLRLEDELLRMRPQIAPLAGGL